MPFVALVLAACGWLPDVEAPEPPPLVDHVGDGWAVRIPEGARVQASPDHLQVDAADGSWWYDLKWLDASGPVFLPLQVATGWGEATCDPLRWDAPHTPAVDQWISGGFCTIQGRRYWVVASVERRGDRALLTGVVASRTSVTYEDLWSWTVRGPMSMSAGATPMGGWSEAAVVDAVRAAHAEDPGPAQLPRPGGGTFSTRVASQLDALWTARRAVPWPEAFAAPTP